MSVENKGGAWQLAVGTKVHRQGEGHMVTSEVAEEDREPEVELDMNLEGHTELAIAAMNAVLENDKSQALPDSIKSY